MMQKTLLKEEAMPPLSASTESSVSWAWEVGAWAAAGTLCKEHAVTCLAVCAAWDAVRHRRALKGSVGGTREECQGLKNSKNFV